MQIFFCFLQQHLREQMGMMTFCPALVGSMFYYCEAEKHKRTTQMRWSCSFCIYIYIDLSRIMCYNLVYKKFLKRKDDASND